MLPIASTITTLLPAGVAATAFDPVTGTLYAAMADGRLLAIDPESGRQVCEWHLCSQLTAISFAADGTFLLAVGSGPAGEAVLHLVETASGDVTSWARDGAFHDVQIVDRNHAILSGAEWLLLDLVTGDLAPIAGLDGFGSDRAIMTADGPLVLLAEWGTSNGELAIFDTRTGTVTARSGNDGGTVAPGYNFGHQAISTEAGLVLQFSYYGLVNAYDLDLNPLGVFDLGERVDGIAFDADGTNFYAYLIDSGVLAQFDATTLDRLGEAEIGSSTWYNFAGSGDQIAFAPNGSAMAITDGADGTLVLAKLAAALPAGGAGDDMLAGTCLADTMRGFAGNDTYVFDHAGDVAIELPGEGTDTIISYLDAVLPDNVENLRLSGPATHGVGNALDNTIRANASAALLEGLDGDDILRGDRGSDTLVGGRGNDRMTGKGAMDDLLGGGGDDYLSGGSGDDFLRGGSGHDRLKGNSGADGLYGGYGDDWLSGGAGSDILSGGRGADLFVFGRELTRHTVPQNQADTVIDFSSAEGDRLDFASIDADHTRSGNQSFDWIGDAAFSGTAGELRYGHANGATIVEGDVDGDAVADFAVRLDGLHLLHAQDFLL